MPIILITLKTLQPLLATSFQGDPNSDVSYDYIPGSMIRGAVIGRYLKRKQQAELNLDDPEVQRLFFANSTRYLNAYLVSQQEHFRTLPIPRSWYKQKDEEPTENQPTWIYDLSIEQDDELESVKSISGQFCIFEKGYIRLYQPAHRINIHNHRDRRKGRSSKQDDQPNSEGEIFRYDALDVEQSFQAVILCEEQDLPLYEQLLSQPDLWLGGSRSAGYGHTQLSYEIKSHKTQTDNKWQETQPLIDEDLDLECLTITLLSDTILSDHNGHPTANPLLIHTAINNTYRSSLPAPTLEHIFSSTNLIGGFNRKWGLPLPQVPALAAGTVITFHNATLTEDQIQQLQWQGVGDRRNEGFGRVAVNWHRKIKFDARKLSKPSSRSQPFSISAASLPLARRMSKQLLRQKLDQVLKAEVGRRKLGTSKISNSQLSRIGAIARKGLSSEPVSLQPLSDLLQRDNLTKTALEQFQQTKLSQTGTSFYDWLQAQISNPKNWIVPLPEVQLNLDVKETVDDSLAIEYTLKLIMAVAKQAIKENQQ
jgi:CRISPR-associated protein Csx10